MNVENIVKNKVLSSNVLTGKVVKGHLNGVVIQLEVKTSLNELNNVFVRAKFIHDEVVYLATEIPLIYLITLSDLDHGSTQRLSQMITAGRLIVEDSDSPVGLKEVETFADENNPSGLNKDSYMSEGFIVDNRVCAYVDFGSIYCDNGHEFQIEIESTVPSSSSPLLNVYSVSREFEPFHFLKYDIDKDNNELHRQIIRSFLLTDEPREGTVYVDSQMGNYSCSFLGLQAVSQIFGRIENISLTHLFELYKSSTGVPDDVEVKMFTNDGKTSDISVMNVRVEVPLELSTTKNIENLKARAEIVRKFEKAQPNQAIAMIASGLLTPSAEIEEQINELIIGE